MWLRWSAAWFQSSVPNSYGCIIECDIFPVSRPSDRNTERFRQWFHVGAHLGPEWSQGASVLKAAVCRWDVGQTFMQQSFTVRARSIFNFCNIVQRIDADTTKKTKILFSLKKYLFSWLYSDREREKKKVPPLIIWQACRHSHSWKALTGLCLQRAAPRTKQPFQHELVSLLFCWETSSYVKRLTLGRRQHGSMHYMLTRI